MSNHQPQVLHINCGFACKVGNKIYINKKLRKHTKLYNAVVKHELEHTDGFEFRDIVTDVKGKHLKKVRKEFWFFILTHPSTWVHFLPVWRYGGRWTLDIVMLVVWIHMIAICYLVTALV